MPNLSDEQWRSLASALSRETARVVPEWTDHNTHDPGIAMLELFAYALTELQFRVPLDARGLALAKHVAQLAESLAAAAGADDCPPGLQRTNFFFGRLLSAEDFTAEQDYNLGKARRHNRLFFGTGVVSGLGVTIENGGSGPQVVIAPGLALDACGNEIEVSAPAPVPLPAQGTSLLVLLHYAEQPCRPLPAPANDPQAQPQFSRITETFTATLAPTTDDCAIALARVHFSQGRWLLDRGFSAVRVRT